MMGFMGMMSALTGTPDYTSFEKAAGMLQLKFMSLRVIGCTNLRVAAWRHNRWAGDVFAP